jgi:NitT/TauT family transport system substrate-binding protein
MRTPRWIPVGILAPLIALAMFTSARAQTADVTLNVGVLPIVDVAPLYLGMEKGYFKDEHLTIVPVTAQGGGEVATAVIAGDEQFGYGNVVSMILAAAHGLPLEAVADGSQSIADGRHANVGMVVLANSPIKTMKDFEGKTVGVNALKTMSELIIKDDLARSGVDISKVKFVEIPNPEMDAALKTGRIDIALEAEPFLSAGKNDGVRNVFEPYDQYAPKITLATYFATHQYVADHPEIVARFKRAMLKSLAYATANPDEVRRILLTYTKLQPSAISNMALVGWSPQIDMPSIVALQNSMVKYSWIQAPVDLKVMFPPAAVAGK